MAKLRNLTTVYRYFLECLINPRIPLTEFFKIQAAYTSENPLRTLLNEAFKREIISRPEIYCNRGVSVELLKSSPNQLELLRECSEDPETTYAIALCGAWAFVRIRRGASDLRFADRIIPTYPGRITPQEIYFDEKGELNPDPYPHGWDEIDWEVYKLMKDPSISFTEATKRSEKEGSKLSRDTIKKHFQKILKDCKVQMNFFPNGYGGYEKIFFTFRTKYELGLYDSLRKLDRTSFLWKTRDLIILILFVEQYCTTVRHFKELEENGLIRNLKVSIPNRHCTPFERDVN